MNLNRRNFLRKTGLLAATPLLMNELWSCSPASKTEEKKSDSTATSSILTEPSVKDFGLQLWTVKEDMQKDPKGVLKSLSEYGYKYIESFGAEKGIFWGMPAKDFKAYLDSLGMTIYSAHCDSTYISDPKKTAEFTKLVDAAASIGMTHLINPYLGNVIKKIDDAKKAAEGMNRCGEICKKAGIKYGYHNHHYSFMKMDGQFAQDIFMTGTDADKVDFEMDIYWVTAAGQDPIEWFKKYPNRFRLCHIKDIYSEDKIKEIQSKEKVDPNFPFNASCNIGEGRIDFPKILGVARDNGVERFIVEQERFDNSTPMRSAQADAEYMKKLVFA